MALTLATNLQADSNLTRTIGTANTRFGINGFGQPIYYVVGPSTDNTAGTWTGTIDGLTAYYDGLTIIYVPYIAGASGTTLNLNNLGDIPCYYNSTALATEYPAGTPILLTYINNTWKRADYDSNTTAISNLINNSGPYVADSAVYRYQLLFQIDENTLTPLNNVSNSTSTSKTMLTDVEFNAFGHIFYYTSTTTISASANIGAGSTAWAWSGINLRYTFNCGTTLTANKPFYLVVTPTSNGKCKIASTTPWAHTLPSTNDGKWYILLGRTYSNYQMHLSPFHPVYKHNGTKIIELIPDGIDCSQFITKTDPEFENSVSMGRKANTTVGSGSVAMGVDVEASANSCYAEGGYTIASAQGAHAEGSHTTASGEASHAEGYYTIASGHLSHAEGDLTTASGVASHTEGVGTVATGALSHVSGVYNIEDSYDDWQEWTASTLYAVGDKVKVTSNNTVTGYICNTANSDSTFTEANWTNRQGQMNYAEIIGNGVSNIIRSNARTLDWDGNEMLAGGLKINDKAHNSNGVQLYIDSGDCQYHNIFFRKNGETVAKIVVNTGTTGDTISNGRFYFTQFSPKSTADSETTGYYQRYDLPTVTTGLTENETYNILTSKNTVTVAQGGTGMTGMTSNSVTSNGVTLSYRKWGKVVWLNYSGNVSSALAKNTTIVTAPDGYRPAASIRIPCRHDSDWKLGVLNSSGQLSINVACVKDGSFYATATFTVA